jgi:hypothetical protein
MGEEEATDRAQPPISSVSEEKQKEVYETQLRLTAIEMVLRGKGYGDDTLKRAEEVFQFLKSGIIPEKSNIHTL